MKRPSHFSLLLFSLTIALVAPAQNQSGVDSTGLPGDNFSLQGALEMFQKATSPEEFEKLLNTENNHVNNLDLNDDGDIDYIRVIDNSDKNAHAFVLQDVVSESESQDIAVIELEKTGDTTAVVQIIGDEDIYGEQVIIEPDGGGDDSFNNSIYNSNTSGPNADYGTFDPRIIINVWFWPTVRFVYAPAYVVWHSPWRWHAYPVWWHPWRPYAWHAWHPYHRVYHTHFAVVHTHRVLYAHSIYTPGRVSSVTVRTHHATVVGNYRVTHTRTTVDGPRGHGVIKTKTTVQGPKGNKATKTKIRRH